MIGRVNVGGGIKAGDKMFCYDWGASPERVYFYHYGASSFIVSNGLGFKDNGDPFLYSGNFRKSNSWGGHELILKTGERSNIIFPSTVYTDNHYPFPRLFAQLYNKKNKMFLMSMPNLSNFYDADFDEESVNANIGLNYWIKEVYGKSAFEVRADFYDISSAKREYDKVFTVPTFDNLKYSLGEYGVYGNGEDVVYVGYRLTDKVEIDEQSGRRTYFKYGDISSAIVRIDIKLRSVKLVKTFPNQKMTLKSISNNKAYVLNVDTNKTEIYDLSTWKHLDTTDDKVNEFISQYGKEKPVSKGGKLPIGNGYYDITTGYIYSSEGDELINVGKDYKIVMLKDNGNLIQFKYDYLYEYNYMTYEIPDFDIRPWWVR